MDIYTVVGYNTFTSKKTNKAMVRLCVTFAIKRNGRGLDVDSVFISDDTFNQLIADGLDIGSKVNIFYNKNGFVSDIQIVA